MIELKRLKWGDSFTIITSGIERDFIRRQEGQSERRNCDKATTVQGGSQPLWGGVTY